MIDIFPTLMDLCKLPKDPELDGVSLAGILEDPAEAKDRSVLLPGVKPREFAIINQDWRYIRYADGGEELYDVRHDPNEWKNLARHADFAGVRERLISAAPTSFAEPGPSARELRLVVTDESFAWRSKRQPVPNIVPQSVAGIRMVPRQSTDEAQMKRVKLAGRPAWKSVLRSGKPTYFYFRLKDLAFRNGRQPAVQISITYLDRGSTAVAVQYDSGDAHVNASHPNGAGVFKKAVRFRVKQSRTWKTTVFNLDDARFAGRCNGGDLRLSFVSPDVDPVVAEVLVKPLR